VFISADKTLHCVAFEFIYNNKHKQQ